MMHLKRLLAVPVLLQLLLCAPALAAGEVPTPGEIKAAENLPPLIPHKTSDAATAKDCLKCHLKGRHATSHPERKMCSQCHAQGEVKQPVKRKK